LLKYSFPLQNSISQSTSFFFYTQALKPKSVEPAIPCKSFLGITQACNSSCIAAPAWQLLLPLLQLPSLLLLLLQVLVLMLMLQMLLSSAASSLFVPRLFSTTLTDSRETE
jgi:hypothetical protein